MARRVACDWTVRNLAPSSKRRLIASHQVANVMHLQLIWRAFAYVFCPYA
jgi:N12 class adenine-specific DNA methylase